MKKCDPIVSVLRRHRELRRISQEEMARKTNISISTIQRIESGRTSMNLIHYRKYLSVLGLSDMDVSVALYSHEYIDDIHVAAAAKRFPPAARRVIAQFLNDLVREMSSLRR
ncbi:helix-turn-helix transcriptional regulator [Vibrio metschnikovii]|nr:helix-turn-helix transcriptional regulator [Vibrio metschnikovii]EKO3874653.1 helix-turn-helix transcriptional regulator [Vibrio metschnikovii]